MSSNLRAITDAITNLSVSYTNEAGATVTPTAKDINQIPVSMGAADLPVRLIGVTSEGGNTDEMVFDAVTTNAEFTHKTQPHPIRWGSNQSGRAFAQRYR
jgi:hypothetical protein